MARKSVLSMKSEVGESRDSKIRVMIIAGFTNESIMSALESNDPSLLPEKDIRRNKNMPAFDKIGRQRTLEAIRSVRFQVKTDDNDIEEYISMTGDGELKSIGDIGYSNIHRFSSGIPSLDHIYGMTNVIHTDGPNKGEQTGVQEFGLPEGFLSIWGGTPGVGKSRLAIAVTKSLNKLGQKVLYFNGEVDESQFRNWCGMDVDPNLFLIRSTSALRLETVANDIIKHRPKVVFVDSLQMIQAAGGINAILARMQMLKNDKEIGLPHIILISQLNKKGELKGSRALEHLVDFVASVTKMEGRQASFCIECNRKNRGGPTPRYATFEHFNGTIRSTGQDNQIDNFELVQNDVSTGPIEQEPLPRIVQFVPA